MFAISDIITIILMAFGEPQGFCDIYALSHTGLTHIPLCIELANQISRPRQPGVPGLLIQACRNIS